MAFLTPGAAGRGVVRAEINMIPLIDVMLVLLVIFMVTAPLLTHAVKLDLPKASSQAARVADKVDISIDAAGQVYWDGEAQDMALLDARCAQLAVGQPETEIRLYADKEARYQRVAEVMTAASRAGLTHIGFVTQPDTKRE